MKIVDQASDDSILRELGGRLAGARLERNLTQAQLATQAGLSKSTLQRLESGSVATQLSGLIRVCRVLGFLARLDRLVPTPVPSPMAQLRLRGRPRRRASAKRKAGPASGTWTWGGES